MKNPSNKKPVAKPVCPICKGLLWVCEDHPNEPFHPTRTPTCACCDSGVGAPCECNPGGLPTPGSFVLTAFLDRPEKGASTSGITGIGKTPPDYSAN